MEGKHWLWKLCQMGMGPGAEDLEEPEWKGASHFPAGPSSASEESHSWKDCRICRGDISAEEASVWSPEELARHERAAGKGLDGP